MTGWKLAPPNVMEILIELSTERQMQIWPIFSRLKGKTYFLITILIRYFFLFLENIKNYFLVLPSGL